MNSMSLMMFVLLLGGGGNTGDLLDYTPTQSYWEMRDQRIVDLDTMSAVLADDNATPTDTLMAIRAIGELLTDQQADPPQQADPADKARALKILTPLTQSKEPFVGRYAKRSIAWIKGEVPPKYAPLPDQVYDHDLALLPAGMTAVGQLKVGNGIGPVDLASLVPDIKIEGRSMRDQMMSQMLPGILQSVQMIGNARADLVTAGIVIEDESGPTVALVVRGQYDRVGVLLALEKELGDKEDWSFYSVGEVEVAANISRYESGAMLMPSDELFILLFTDVNDGVLPIDEVVKKLQDDNPKPSFDPALAKQIEAIDRGKADVWAAMRVTDFMKSEREINEVFGAFDAARAMATRDAEGKMDIQWVGEGRDAAAIEKTASFLTDSIKEAVGEINQQKLQMPAEMQALMDPMITMMESMKFNAEGKAMTGGMKVDPTIGMTMPMMMFGVRASHVHEAPLEAVDAVEEVAD